MADAAGLRRKVEQRGRQIAVAVKDDRVLALSSAAPFDTGETQEKIKGTVSGTAGRYRIRLTSPTPQSVWTDKGTRPHVIRPRRARALRFTSGGTVVFARRVNHPGNAGTGWWSKQVTPQAVRQAVGRAIRRATPGTGGL